MKQALTLLSLFMVFGVFTGGEAHAQSKRFHVGIKPGVVLPTSNFTEGASTGFGGQGSIGYWYDSRLLLKGTVAFHQFGSKELDSGQTVKGAFLPVEIGFHYLFRPDRPSLYLMLLGGLYFNQQDFKVEEGDTIPSDNPLYAPGANVFEGNNAGFTLGLGYSYPLGTSGTRLNADFEYRSTISTPFLSYLVLNVGIEFRL